MVAPSRAALVALALATVAACAPRQALDGEPGPFDDRAAEGDPSAAARVVARLSGRDLAGAARLLGALGERGVPVDAEVAALVRALSGDLTSVARLLAEGLVAPAARPWLQVGAARGLARRHPLAGVALAWPAMGPDAAGRAARALVVRQLDAAGSTEAAAEVLAAGLGDPAHRLEGVPRRVVRAVAAREDALGEAERAWLLYDAHARDAARVAFDRALVLAPEDGAARCWALEGSGRLALLEADPGVGWVRLREAQRACPDHPLAGETLVLLARLAYVRRDHDALRDQLARAAARGPAAADRDGITALAALAGARGPARDLAERVRRRYARWPFRDIVAEEAWDAWERLERRGRLEAAEAVLAPLVEAGYRPGRSRVWGLVDYWHARTLERLGRVAEAADAMARAAERFPLTWYGLAALADLARLDPERASRVRAALAPGMETPEAPALWGDDPRAALAARRIHVLARWGLVDAVVDEARDAELTADARRAAWVAERLSRMGAPTEAVAFARDALDRLGLRSPLEGPRELWRAAWPRPFADTVRDQAAEAGLEPELVWAVMRIESLYRTTAVSPAGARGLLQLMPRTADWLRQIGGRPGPDVDLHDPPDNVRLGVDLLARLADRFDGRRPLVLAGYNAGSGRVSRWLREQRPADLARFVEDMPYSEARNYVRSVMSAWAVYEWLDGCRCVVDLAPDLAPPPDPRAR